MKRPGKRLPNTAWIRSWLLLWGAASMVTLLPTLTEFLDNQHEVSGPDLVLPILLDLSIGVFVTAIVWRVYRRDRLAGFLAAIMAATIFGSGYDGRLSSVYSLISAFIPASGLGQAQGIIYSLVFIALTSVLALTTGRLLSRLAARHTKRSDELVTALFIATAVTFAFQVIPTIQTVANAWPQYFYKPPPLTSSASSASKSKPDIYYIVLDRYASPAVFQTQFEYSNADFLQFLAVNQYYVNADSHQNYPYTTMSIASTLNAGYHQDQISKFAGASSQTLVPYHRSIQYGSVIQKLKSLGYEYDQIGSWYEATNQSPLGDKFYLSDGQLTFFGHRTSLNNFPKQQLQQSILWRPLEQGIKLGGFTLLSYAGLPQADLTAAGLKQLQTYANSSSSGGHFVFAHLLIPHDPYDFNADGSRSATPDSNNIGKPIKQKYLGQVAYVNSQMKSILAQINQTSKGQAVVILQSDEGPYPIQLNHEVFEQGDVDSEVNGLDMRKWTDADLAMKYGNMAAYHIPAASPDQLKTGATTLNVFRLVLNTYFGDSQPFLPECYYAYPNGRQQPFVYDDITARLTGQPGRNCTKNGTGPKP